MNITGRWLVTLIHKYFRKGMELVERATKPHKDAPLSIPDQTRVRSILSVGTAIYFYAYSLPYQHEFGAKSGAQSCDAEHEFDFVKHLLLDGIPPL